MIEEKKRRYWIGKNPKTRIAVEKYVSLYQANPLASPWGVVRECGVSWHTLQKHLRELAKRELYGLYLDRCGIRKILVGSKQ